MKILLLEDDLELCKNIKISLEKENYMVDCCNDGETAMLYALNTDYAYDLAIVDRMLPIIDGLTIIKSMRRKGISIPILIITAMSTLDNRVEGLDGGADDYLVKPFHIKELLARVRALTRRPANIQLSSKLQYGDLTFDKDSRTLSTPNNSLLLTSKETELTFVFMQNPETLFSREQLILKIWGSSSEVETGNVDSYISFLRKRL
ncbi:response regulator transcription factor, partial [Clostridioides difficile]